MINDVKKPQLLAHVVLDKVESVSTVPGFIKRMRNFSWRPPAQVSCRQRLLTPSPSPWSCQSAAIWGNSDTCTSLARTVDVVPSTAASPRANAHCLVNTVVHWSKCYCVIFSRALKENFGATEHERTEEDNRVCEKSQIPWILGILCSWGGRDKGTKSNKGNAPLFTVNLHMSGSPWEISVDFAIRVFY